MDWNDFAFGFSCLVVLLGAGLLVNPHGELALARELLRGRVWPAVGLRIVFGLVLLPIVGLISAGGWGEVSAGLAAQDPTLLDLAGVKSTASFDGRSLFGLMTGQPLAERDSKDC